MYFRQIYWLDTYLDFVERCNYDGEHRKTIIRGSRVENMKTLTVFQNYFYFTSWKDSYQASVTTLNKLRPSVQFWKFQTSYQCQSWCIIDKDSLLQTDYDHWVTCWNNTILDSVHKSSVC